MAQCGILTELEDQSRFELFQSVQEYVFSAKDKEDFLQFSESDQVHWLRGVDRAAAKVWRYLVHATAREYFQSSVFGPTVKGKVEQYQPMLQFDQSSCFGR